MTHTLLNCFEVSWDCFRVHICLLESLDRQLLLSNRNEKIYTSYVKLHCEPRHHTWPPLEPEQVKYRIVSGPFIVLSCLQDQLVDEGSRDPTEDGTNPVDPVIGPGIEDHGRSEGPGWVHAGAGFYVECRFCTKTMRSQITNT